MLDVKNLTQEMPVSWSYSSPSQLTNRRARNSLPSRVASPIICLVVSLPWSSLNWARHCKPGSVRLMTADTRLYSRGKGNPRLWSKGHACLSSPTAAPSTAGTEGQVPTASSVRHVVGCDKSLRVGDRKLDTTQKTAVLRQAGDAENVHGATVAIARHIGQLRP